MFRADKGQLWENMVYRLLAEAHGFDAVKYWRTADGNEVDFFYQSGPVPKAIEVKYDKHQHVLANFFSEAVFCSQLRLLFQLGNDL